MQKVPRKGSSSKHSLYKDTHRNGFNDAISHEVSPYSYHYHTYSWRVSFFHYFPRDLSLYLGLLFPVLVGTPNRVGWRPSHIQTCQLTWGPGPVWCLKGILRWIVHMAYILTNNLLCMTWGLIYLMNISLPCLIFYFVLDGPNMVLWETS